MFSINSEEIIVNLLAVISVHWNEKVQQLIIPLSECFIPPPSQKELSSI